MGRRALLLLLLPVLVALGGLEGSGAGEWGPRAGAPWGRTAPRSAGSRGLGLQGRGRAWGPRERVPPIYCDLLSRRARLACRRGRQVSRMAAQRAGGWRGLGSPEDEFGVFPLGSLSRGKGSSRPTQVGAHPRSWALPVPNVQAGGFAF